MTNASNLKVVSSHVANCRLKRIFSQKRIWTISAGSFSALKPVNQHLYLCIFIDSLPIILDGVSEREILTSLTGISRQRLFGFDFSLLCVKAFFYRCRSCIPDVPYIARFGTVSIRIWCTFVDFTHFFWMVTFYVLHLLETLFWWSSTKILTFECIFVKSNLGGCFPYMRLCV